MEKLNRDTIRIIRKNWKDDDETNPGCEDLKAEVNNGSNNKTVTQEQLEKIEANKKQAVERREANKHKEQENTGRSTDGPV